MVNALDELGQENTRLRELLRESREWIGDYFWQIDEGREFLTRIDAALGGEGK